MKTFPIPTARRQHALDAVEAVRIAVAAQNWLDAALAAAELSELLETICAERLGAKKVAKQERQIHAS